MTVRQDGRAVEASGEEQVARSLGTQVDEVVLDIDYAIIRHFSQHLYGSPNKAIEELVANSFDAFATSAYVYVPGDQVRDRVLVWDNGTSMDVAGLKALWVIARSPKGETAERIASVGGRTRKLIGKFGIGKLASYAVGSRVSHLCRLDGRNLLVGIDYRDVTTDLNDQEPGSRYVAPILELSDVEASAWIDGAFAGPSKARQALADAPTYTIAVVDELRDDVGLPPGRLAWVLGNAMPLRPDFRVWVNDAEVEPRLGRGAAIKWDLSNASLRHAVETAWSEGVTAGRVAGDLTFAGANGSGARPTAEFPNLGRVSAEVSIFVNTLQRPNETRDERSYGFFVMIRDRLLNVDDEKLYLADPSFGTFYRTQFVIHADSLDDNLLAGRDRLREDARTAELAALQQGMYRAARAEIERQDAVQDAGLPYISLLPTASRDLYRDPLTTLILRESPTGAPDFDFQEPHVTREDLAEDQPVSVLSLATNGFQVNVAHPFFAALREQLGTGATAEKAMRAFDALAVSERLLEGFLFDMGIAEAQVARILNWRDGLLRALGARYRDTADDVIAEVRNASFRGRAAFETALARLFSLMGFVATRKGGSGDEDVLVIGPTGVTATRFIVEGKGSKNPVPNDKAEISGAAAHAGTAGAQLAIVVAREFVGFKGGDDPAILVECRSVSSADRTVSIVDVETIIDLYHAVRRFSYPLEVIVPVLAVIEGPADKRARIAVLASPVDNFDYKALLEELWRRQQQEASGDAVPFRHVWQTTYKDGGLSLEDFEAKLVALDTLSGGLMRLETAREVTTLLQSPQIISEAVRRNLGE